MTDKPFDNDDDRKEKAERAYTAVDKLLDGIKFPDAPTPLDELAMAQAEVASTFEKHGFSRKESLYMTACMFNGTPGQAPPA